jgi:signal transduction histidine kinase
MPEKPDWNGRAYWVSSLAAPHNSKKFMFRSMKKNRKSRGVPVPKPKKGVRLRPPSGADGGEETLHLLSARLLQVQDDERRRIARDLHDVTGQKIAFQAMLLSRLGREAKDAEQQSLIGECQTITTQISDEIRTLSYLLHPPLLDELGLASAIQWYAEGFRARTGIDLSVDVARDFPRLAADVEIALFRVLQESLTNTHRYAASETAEVRLNSDAETITLEIFDFGRGISADQKGKAKHGADGIEMLGVGIRGMRERMKQLSGQLKIQSNRGEGTRVTATVPLEIARRVQDGDDEADVSSSGAPF